MPAAKYSQLDATNEASGHGIRANFSYLEANCQQYKNPFNGNRWTQRQEPEVRINHQASEADHRGIQCHQQAGSAVLANPSYQQQDMIRHAAFQQREGRSHSENNCIEAENNSFAFTSNQPFYSLSDRQEVKDENFEAFGLDQNQMPENYQCYSSFESSDNYTQHIPCSRDPPPGRYLSATRDRESFRLNSGAEPPYNGISMNRVYEKRQKFGMAPMSQADQVPQQISQTAARQFPPYKQDASDLDCNEFSDQNNSLFFSFDQVTSERVQTNCRGQSSTEEVSLNMEDKSGKSNNALGEAPHKNNNTENSHGLSYPCDDLSRETLRCSISSDPEIYTKSPSVEKLNVKIQKLRDEMLALRSTTDSYKQHMESMFDELRHITQMNDEKLPWANTEDSHRIVDGQAALSVSRCKDPFLYARSRAGNASDQNMECLVETKDSANNMVPYIHHKDSQKTFQPVASSQMSPNYEHIFDVHPQPHATRPYHEHASNEIKRGQSNARPNSDPFSCSADPTNMVFSSSTEQTTLAMSLPLSQSSGKCNGKTSILSPLESGVKRTDHLRLLPVLSKTNVALHISECSIDSGYQDSSLISPRERHGRELASQAVTPASPIDESPLETPDKPPLSHEAAQLDGNIKGGYESNRLHDARNTLQTAAFQTNQHSDERVGLYAVSPSQNTFHKNNEENEIATILNDSDRTQATFQQPKMMKLKSYDGPSCYIDGEEALDKNIIPKGRMGRSSSAGNESDDLQKCGRPIPKQRTVFSSSNKFTQKAGLERNYSSPDSYLNEDGLTASNKLDHSTPVRTDLEQRDEKKQSSKTCSEDKGTQQNFDIPINKPLPSRPTPPQCLTVAKRAPQASNDTGSPVQSRVKLGISSIKLTPDSEKNEGSLFYCTGQVSKPKTATSRSRKTANTKQLLREKFAAVVEHSSSGLNRDDKPIEGDNESTVFRRRSMKMMTEFQIFDFKNSKTGSSKTGKKPADELNRQTQSKFPKYLSSSISNNLSKSAPTSRNAVSGSATTVPKELYEAGKKNSRKSTQSKPPRYIDRKLKHGSCELNSPGDSHNYEKVYLSYTGEPLPPPPPSPPRSPPVVDDNPPEMTNSQAPVFAKAELIPHGRTKQPDGVFLAPLIRPKASLPGVSCDVDPPEMPKSTYNGLKISPNAKSAFTPVLSASSQSLEIKSSPVPDQCGDSSQDKCAPADIKRRSSLPSAVVSNKQRFLREFMPANSHDEPAGQSHSTNLPDDDKQHFYRQSSLRLSKKSNVTVASARSDERVVDRSHNGMDREASKQAVPKTRPFVTTEPLFSEMPKHISSSKRKEKEKRPPTSSEKTTSGRDRPDLESQPFRYARGDKMTDVVGALKTAGFLRNSNLGHGPPKVSGNFTSSQGARQANEKLPHTSHLDQQPSRPTRPRDFDNIPPRHMKPHSSKLMHQYEVIQPIDTKKTSKEDHGRKQVARQQTFSDSAYLEDGGFEQSPTKSHKSTVAMIRDSLMGRRDKSSRSANNDRRRDVSNEVKPRSKSRSSSVGAKGKDTIEPPFQEPKSSVSKSKSKDSKSKKHKTDSKPQKDKSSSRKKTSKDQQKAVCSKNMEQLPPEIRPPSPVLPDAGPRRYGDPDSEVMQRFLAAAAASHTNRTPMQRLRSSLRVPKNKNKFLNTSRIKDDMDVASMRHPVQLGSKFDKTFPHGQEFTYV